jgi:hypothetical protein
MDEKCVGCLIAARNFRQFASVYIKPFNYSRKLTFFLKNQQFACLINAFAQFAYAAICKLGKGIN